MRTIGTSTNRMPPEVGIFSRVSFSHHGLTRVLLFIGPGIGPGVMIGPSSTSNTTGTSVSASSTPNTATPIVRLGGRGSKAGLITGGIVGGIAAMSLLVAALLFYQRRCRSQASSATQSAVESVGESGDSLSGYFAYNTPMLSQIPSRTSSRRNPYTVSPVLAPQPRGQRVLPTV